MVQSDLLGSVIQSQSFCTRLALAIKRQLQRLLNILLLWCWHCLKIVPSWMNLMYRF